MADGWRVLVRGGVLVPTDPGSAATFLRATPPGAYTTTRTVDGASSVLLWDRHMARLYESLQLLSTASPDLYPHVKAGIDVKQLVEPSLIKTLARALELRSSQEEIILTVLLCRSKSNQSELESSGGCEVFVHAANYDAVGKDEILPGARVAVMGPGRSMARAKSSLWASTRQVLERVKPADTSEIVLSNDGDALLEGMVTNFYVVKNRKEKVDEGLGTQSQDHAGVDFSKFEILTAPLSDGVLPGVMRSLILDICRDTGIRLREVAPSWANRHTWREAFLTNGLRFLQPVKSIQMPVSWDPAFNPKAFEEALWEDVNLEMCGAVTRQIYQLLVDRACQHSTHITTFVR